LALVPCTGLGASPCGRFGPLGHSEEAGLMLAVAPHAQQALLGTAPEALV